MNSGVSKKGNWLDAWHVGSSANKNYEVLDGLRGVAILLVVCAHHVYVNPNSGALTKYLGALCHSGGYGVSVFFAISGFLISWPFWRLKTKDANRAVPRGYGWRRFWKIYPPLALSVLVFAPIYAWVSGDSSFYRLAGLWLTGVPLITPVSSKLNPVMWSLVVEVQFYILLPVLFLLLKRVSTRTCLWILPLLFLLVPLIFQRLNASRGIYFSLSTEVNVLFPSLLDNFAFGVLVAGFENLGCIRKAWARYGDVGIAMLLLAFFVSAWIEVQAPSNAHMWSEVPSWLVKLGSAGILCYIADPQSFGARLLSSAWLRWCGIISYEWYLLHQPILWWLRAWLGPSNGSVTKYLVIQGGSAAAGLVLAAVMYRFFSLPILRRGRAKHTVPAPSSGDRSETVAATIVSGG